MSLGSSLAKNTSGLVPPKVKAFTVSGAEPLLVSVTNLKPLDTPTVSEPKLRDVGEAASGPVVWAMAAGELALALAPRTGNMTSVNRVAAAITVNGLFDSLGTSTT